MTPMELQQWGRIGPWPTKTEKPMSERDPKTDQFLQGVSGNPAGRPKGSRNRLGEQFLQALADDFAEHGAATIEAARLTDPVAYIRMVAGLVPKELLMWKDPIDELSDQELADAIDFFRGRISTRADGDVEPTP